ncbi:class I SAM-dependent methyltransferase [Sandaracinus amylolyticus]|uniref:Methyltransferase type 11 n=1 Tax=Sandaracinus amylolyticus TaxID=927083 RepID=A0A0F6YJC8_9BACT|nr:class I SAM-dependent methyltransferase [Sandaracinus amylolyticus]AKF06870.1 Methyltransferase type 11 [Sandaracinus amylolyticus]
MSAHDARAKRYYDDFSSTYDRGRDEGYHALVDRLESQIVIDHARDADVLEVGCGTGLVLARVAPHAARCVGVDLSAGMIAQARARGLDVARGSATALPFRDASFDVVYSFKVLAHVPAIERALEEIARVTRPGGHMLLEFYNAWSLRYVARRLAGARRIGRAHTEADVETRWDSPRAIRRMLPRGTELVDMRGVRVVTPAAFVHRVPLVSTLFARAEEHASRSMLRTLGGFLVAVVRRR